MEKSFYGWELVSDTEPFSDSSESAFPIVLPAMPLPSALPPCYDNNKNLHIFFRAAYITMACSLMSLYSIFDWMVRSILGPKCPRYQNVRNWCYCKVEILSYTKKSWDSNRINFVPGHKPRFWQPSDTANKIKGGRVRSPPRRSVLPVAAR